MKEMAKACASIVEATAANDAENTNNNASIIANAIANMQKTGSDETTTDQFK